MTRAKVKVGKENPAYQAEGKQGESPEGVRGVGEWTEILYELDSRELRGER